MDFDGTKETVRTAGARVASRMTDEFIDRFSGLARLFSFDGARRLAEGHVAVIGLGGVGSWAAEALARSGIGRLSLVDLDDVCVTNINRQVQALTDTVGQSKVQAMAVRIGRIHPGCSVEPRAEFFTASTADAILSGRIDYVVDAIDDVANKCLLIARCRERGIPVVVCGGAGGKRDATAVRVEDLAKTSHDRLLQKVRERLRQEHGFPQGGKQFGVRAVYSMEAPVFPQANGDVCCKREPGSELRLNCDSGFGTAVFVTGAFGFAAAAEAVRAIARGAERESQ